MKKYQFIFYSLVLWALLFSSCKSYKTDHIDSVSLEMHDSIMVDSAMLQIIDTYKGALDSIMNVIVGYSELSMEKGQPESLLGNFVCDLLLQITLDKYGDSLGLQNKSMVLMNSGGFRSALPRGAITVGDVYRLMPFDNELVILRVPGKAMKDVFSIIALKGGMPIAGVEIVLHADEYSKAIFGGEAFVEEKDYFVVTSDYIANGGDEITGLSENTMYLHTGILIRDAIIEYFNNISAEGKTANPKKDGRIRYE